MKYCKSYCEEKEISTSKLNEAQQTLHYIAENLKMDTSISEEGYKHFQMAIQALEQEPCEDVVSRQTVKEQMIKYGFHAPDMTVMEFVEDELPSVQPMRKRDDVLDKIRAEIMSKDGLEEALEIIDRYTKDGAKMVERNEV